MTPRRLPSIGLGIACCLAIACSRVKSAADVWGVEPVSIRPVAGGHLLYFRYKVVDAKKARSLFDRRIKPYLVEEKTGAKIGMAEEEKLGALRASPRNGPVEGKEYYVLFANPRGRMGAGSKVAVAIGDLKLGGLVVQ